MGIDWNNWNLDDILWIPDIDKKEWFYKEKGSINYNDIEELEEKYEINIFIDKKSKKIIFKKNNIEIGKIEPWIYSHNNFENNNHLYKKLSENYRWKWLGYLLFYLYNKEIWFSKEEYSHTESVIKLLLEFWYEIVWIVKNWEIINFTNIEYFSNIEKYQWKTIKLKKID